MTIWSHTRQTIKLRDDTVCSRCHYMLRRLRGHAVLSLCNSNSHGYMTMLMLLSWWHCGWKNPFDSSVISKGWPLADHLKHLNWQL